MSTRPRDGKRKSVVFLCLTLGAILAPPACTQRTDVSLGAQPTTTETFVSPDAEAPEAAAGLVQYCPSDECPTGHTTCPLSSFRCDVNLLTDRNNCGACGVVCPETDKGAAFECADGKCVMQCKEGYGDCDGVVDNGCESTLSTDDNCRSCGNECAAGISCIWRGAGYGCGCPDGETVCSNGLYMTCIDTSSNDSNCGVCGNACDPGTIQLNTYQGCRGGTCGHAKCISEWGDCDFDAGNGCETLLNTKENCNGCGRACSGEQECRYVQNALMPPVLMCTCPEGETFCTFRTLNGIPVGRCFDLRSDPGACGACGTTCSSEERCAFGVCRTDCVAGTDDCNGSKMDSCEVNTNSDPNNCGGCRIQCDGVAGQACVGGRCVVKPCDEVDAGRGPTR